MGNNYYQKASRTETVISNRLLKANVIVKQKMTTTRNKDLCLVLHLVDLFGYQIEGLYKTKHMTVRRK